MGNKGIEKPHWRTFLASWFLLAGLPLASLAPAVGQSVIPPERIDACKVAPEGGACDAVEKRRVAALAELRVAFASPNDCARIVKARDLFARGEPEWMQLEALRIPCQKRQVDAELEILKGPDQRGTSKTPNKSSAAEKDPFALAPAPKQQRAPKDPFALPDKPVQQRDVKTQLALNMQPTAPPPNKDQFANYRSYDRDGSAVPVEGHSPGDPWKIERDGVPIGVLRLGEALELDDASQRLKTASSELEQQRLMREAAEREAARRTAQERQEAAWRQEQQRIDREIERQEEREDAARRRERNSQILGAIGNVLEAYNNKQGARLGIPPSSYSGSGSYSPPSGGYSSGPDPARAACDRQISAAASRLANAPRGGGICQSAQALARIAADAERAYAGCQQYYAGDYQETVRMRREAEATARASCDSGGGAGGGTQQGDILVQGGACAIQGPDWNTIQHPNGTWSCVRK